jgi:hypothetical protein
MVKTAQAEPETDVADVVGLLIEMNTRPNPPNSHEIDVMLEAARMDTNTLGRLVLQRISKMTHDAVGMWFKIRIFGCVKQHGSGRQKNAIEGIAKHEGWLKQKRA